jgi:hypothetical protein
MQTVFRHFRREWFWIAPLILAALCGVLFLVYEATLFFPDPDSFYHARIAERMASDALIQQFPWLPFTTLAEHFADQHFAYHLFLMPFVTVFDPLIGIKIATVVLAIAFVLTFYFVLKSFAVRWPFLFTAALLAVNPFTFRLGLAKGTGLALLVLFLGLWALFHFRWKWLAFFAFAYTFVHGGFFILGLATAFFIAVSMISNALKNVDHRYMLGKLFATIRRGLRFRKHPYLHLKLAIGVGLGFLLGLVLNPYFPNNIFFLYEQFVEIGLLNAQQSIGVGGEWYPYAIGDLLPNTILATLALVIALPAFFATLKKQTKQSWTLFLLTLLFFLFTLKSRRYVEYYVPLSFAFSAFAVTAALAGRRIRDALPFLPPWPRASALARTFMVAVLTLVAILLPTVMVRDVITEREDFHGGFELTTYAKSMEALQIISAPGDIVVHSDWDEFPILFYRNQKNRYLAGLDATFLYRGDPDRYWTWVEITLGKYGGNVTEAVRNDLQASWVFVAKDHTAMDSLLRTKTPFPVVYEDEEVKIYDARP